MNEEIIRVVDVELPVNEELIIQKHRMESNNASEKRICVVTGIHGDELEGQYVAYEVARRISESPDSLQGTVDIYPALNPLGMDTGVRTVPVLDTDLNHMFPGSEDGTMMEKVISKVVDSLKGAEVIVDVHASDTFVKEIPQARISEEFEDMMVPYAKQLDVDLILITGDGAPIPSVHENIFQRAAHEIRSCISSFTVDYNSLGDKFDATDDVLDIWITTGRDQSTVLKTMVDDTFTAKTGIKVNVKLVQADAILTAVVAGNGPDLVLSVSGWFAVNYAMRNAVEDLTQFPDYEQVVQPFYPSILEPLTYNNGTRTGVYGLPETQNFPLLFYRADVMEELGLPIPQTWEELISQLPTIQGNSLTVAVNFPDIAVADISVLDSMIFQNGGQIYDAEAKRTLIDSEEGVTAFKQYTSLYNDYGLPVVFDFVSRFRSGEMPLGVASYATYNTLMVSAPEIRGLWDFTLFPGTRKEDGTIDRTAQTDGLCCLMIATENETTRNNAWEFMKWWVSADAQVRFGREMESVLGASARYQTANRDALRQLAWSNAQLKVLEEQMAHTRGFPEIAGGYSTTRHITNAIRRVINTKEDPRETLLNYARTINEEIRIKRREFNLPLD